MQTVDEFCQLVKSDNVHGSWALFLEGAPLIGYQAAEVGKAKVISVLKSPTHPIGIYEVRAKISQKGSSYTSFMVDKTAGITQGVNVRPKPDVSVKTGEPQDLVDLVARVAHLETDNHYLREEIDRLNSELEEYEALQDQEQVQEPAPVSLLEQLIPVMQPVVTQLAEAYSKYITTLSERNQQIQAEIQQRAISSNKKPSKAEGKIYKFGNGTGS